MIEYIRGKWPASLTILSSHSSKHSSKSQNISVRILLAINNFLLKNYEEAYRLFALLVIENPNDPKHLFNFASYLHQYSQIIFKMQTRESSQASKALQYIKKAKKMFDQVVKLII